MSDVILRRVLKAMKPEDVELVMSRDAVAGEPGFAARQIMAAEGRGLLHTRQRARNLALLKDAIAEHLTGQAEAEAEAEELEQEATERSELDAQLEAYWKPTTPVEQQEPTAPQSPAAKRWDSERVQRLLERLEAMSDENFAGLLSALH